jgi:hypothetical protein
MTLSLFIELIIKEKKPLVGHYPGFDVGYPLDSFIVEIPDNYPE